MMFLCIAVLMGLCFAQDQDQDFIVRTNSTGLCFANNSNCDNMVGVWRLDIVSIARASPPNGITPFPLSSSSISCQAAPYSFPAVCVMGYSEEDGTLLNTCFWDDATASSSRSERVWSFEGGYVTNGEPGVGSCAPFRAITRDKVIANVHDRFSPQSPACPYYPELSASCDAVANTTRNYFTGDRVVTQASSDDGSVRFTDQPSGNCSNSNGGITGSCDWLVGSWNGFSVSRGFSVSAALGESDWFYPTSSSDVACARLPYALPIECEIGYDLVTGDLNMFCLWKARAVKPLNTTAYGSLISGKQTVVQTKIHSIRNGLIDANGLCNPMDRYDDDTFIYQLANDYNSESVQPACGSAGNYSPNLDIECKEATASEAAINVAYAVLQRV